MNGLERAIIELENYYNEEYLSYGFANEYLADTIQELKNWLGW